MITARNRTLLIVNDFTIKITKKGGYIAINNEGIPVFYNRDLNLVLYRCGRKNMPIKGVKKEQKRIL